jgi:RNA polymerase sigma-70 factor (ECF subfamily)
LNDRETGGQPYGFFLNRVLSYRFAFCFSTFVVTDGVSSGESIGMLTTEQQEQFTQLWTQAQPTVACFVHTSVRDRGQAEDLLQEIAMTLLRKFTIYDLSKPFLPWAMGVAKFAILGSRRDYARSRLIFDETLLERISQTLLEIVPTQREEEVFLDDCLTKLAPKARKMIRLRYYDSLDSGEIARLLGTTEVAIRVGLLRIREQLRKCIESQYQRERSLP